MLPGQARDSASIARPGTTVDSEGNMIDALGAATAVRATWGPLSDQQQMIAGQRGVNATAALIVATGTDVKVGDIVTVRGQKWIAADVRDVITHTRVLLREQSP